MFITYEMKMKAEKPERRAIDKAVDKKESDMIHTVHQDGMDVQQISHAMSMDQYQVQSILQQA